MNEIASWIFMVVIIFSIIIILYFSAPVNNPEVWIYVGIIMILIIIILYLITVPVTVKLTCNDLITKIDYDTRYYKLKNNS
uniref:Uncharacterized protein n=1 Tax=Moumouvirus sp. 'Monve' TaxID=1128131 RepID=H2ECV0_9VIRU|nr:hypothetical protein mv_R18 [Moumouvirus Monve]